MPFFSSPRIFLVREHRLNHPLMIHSTNEKQFMEVCVLVEWSSGHGNRIDW